MQLAVNPYLINKPPQEALKQYSGCFTNTDLTIEQLGECLAKGHAFCAQVRDGRRKKANFIAAGFLAVDVDHGLTLDAVQAHPYFRDHAALLYTTASHTPEAHRFRIVFSLERPICDPQDMEWALSGLISKFGGDEACSDASHLFYGASGCAQVFLPNTLAAEEVDKLILRGRETHTKSDCALDKHAKSATRSEIRLSSTSSIRLEDGTAQLLKDTPPQIRIFCPQHVDERPSAFTVRSKSGVAGVHCKACNATYFVEDGDLPNTTFDRFWQALLGHDSEPDRKNRIYAGLRGGEIAQINTPFLEFDRLLVEPRFLTPRAPSAQLASLPGMEDRMVPITVHDVTLVRSPKGTGKTEWLRQLVRKFRHCDASVLLIGHRRSLINATAKRLRLTSYLSSPPNSGSTSDEFGVKRSYAICVDSLPKLDPVLNKYDVVIIDEVEQVLSHLLATTMEHRRSVLEHFSHYMKQAKALYVLDADLGDLTFEVLHTLLDNRDRSYHGIYNNWRTSERTIELSMEPNNDALVGELICAVKQNRRCYVCSNNKKLIKTLTHALSSLEGKRLMSITSDEVAEPSIQDFIANIQTEALNYDVILVSPALGTGVDITFPGGACRIDEVFGFFEARITTHFDMDQQLCRVRNPGRVRVWISPQRFSFETDPSVIRTELNSIDHDAKRSFRIEDDGTKTFDDLLYQEVFCHVTSLQRQSKNSLRDQFTLLRESAGWQVKPLSPNVTASSDGKSTKNMAKEALDNQLIAEICGARLLDSNQYSVLRSKPEPSNADMMAMRRFEIEMFYRRSADVALVREDDSGRRRRAIREFALLRRDVDALTNEDVDEMGRFPMDRENRVLRRNLWADLLTVAGFYVEGNFRCDIVLTNATLAPFVELCKLRSERIAALLNIPLRADLESKAVQQLGELLRILGIRLVRQVSQKGGKKTYTYRINQTSVSLMEEMTDKYLDPVLLQEWKAEVSRRADNYVEVAARRLEEAKRLRQQSLEAV